MLMLEPKSRQLLMNSLALDEGFRGRKYKDTKGIETIGYGINLETEDMPEPIARAWMEYKVREIELELAKVFPDYIVLCDPRKSVLINIAYNCGVVGLMTFRRMITNLQAKNYDGAADEVVNSEIAPARSHRLAKIMRTGEWQ